MRRSINNFSVGIFIYLYIFYKTPKSCLPKWDDWAYQSGNHFLITETIKGASKTGVDCSHISRSLSLGSPELESCSIMLLGTKSHSCLTIPSMMAFSLNICCLLAQNGCCPSRSHFHVSDINMKEEEKKKEGTSESGKQNFPRNLHLCAIGWNCTAWLILTTRDSEKANICSLTLWRPKYNWGSVV